MKFLLIIMALIAGQARAESLPNRYIATCFKEHVRPFQEKMGEFFEENKSLKKENQELKAILKNIQENLGKLEAVNKQIRSEVNKHTK